MDFICGVRGGKQSPKNCSFADFSYLALHWGVRNGDAASSKKAKVSSQKFESKSGFHCRPTPGSSCDLSKDYNYKSIEFFILG